MPPGIGYGKGRKAMKKTMPANPRKKATSAKPKKR
jgi:hypothetical protein